MSDPDHVLLNKILGPNVWAPAYPSTGVERATFIMKECARLKDNMKTYRSNTLPFGAEFSGYLISLTGICPVTEAGECRYCYLERRGPDRCSLVQIRKISRTASPADLIKKIDAFLMETLSYLEKK